MNGFQSFQLSFLACMALIYIPLIVFAIRLFFRENLVVSGWRAGFIAGVIILIGFMVMSLIQGWRSTVYFLIPIAALYFVIILILGNRLMIFNVDELPFRESIRTVLQRLNIQFTETFNKVTFNDASTVLEITYVPFYASGFIHFRGKFCSEFLTELQAILKDSRTKRVNWLAYLILFFGVFYLLITLSGFLPGNGMGMSSIPYGRPLTFGEEVLSNSFDLVPLGFLLYGILGIILGIRLLYRHPVLVSGWWFILPGLFILIVFVLRAILSQMIYGFDSSDSLFALLMTLLAFPIWHIGHTTYWLFDIMEEDLIDCLKAASLKNNIPFIVSNSTIILGNENNSVSMTPSRWSTATISIDAKSFPNHKNFFSDIGKVLGKKQLIGFPTMGLITILASVALLGYWFLPLGMGYIFKLFGE